MTTKSLCPCCSGKTYDHCCSPYHHGIPPESALLLMRSRYSAYALKLAEYLIKTTHPLNPRFKENKDEWRKQILEFSNKTTFQKLEILSFKESDPTAEVLFTAYLKQGNKDATFTERSRFEKLNGIWYYLDGQVYQGAVC